MRAGAGVSADLRSPARRCVGVRAQEHDEDVRGGDEFSCGDAPASGLFSCISPGCILPASSHFSLSCSGGFPPGKPELSGCCWAKPPHSAIKKEVGLQNCNLDAVRTAAALLKPGMLSASVPCLLISNTAANNKSN